MAETDKPTTQTGIHVNEELHKRKVDLRDFLQSEFANLCRDTLSKELILDLYSLKVITESQRDECDKVEVELSKNKKLYDIIFKKKQITLFIVALERSSNAHIIDIIHDTLRCCRENVDSIANCTPPNGRNGSRDRPLESVPTDNEVAQVSAEAQLIDETDIDLDHNDNDARNNEVNESTETTALTEVVASTPVTATNWNTNAVEDKLDADCGEHFKSLMQKSLKKLKKRRCYVPVIIILLISLGCGLSVWLVKKKIPDSEVPTATPKEPITTLPPRSGSFLPLFYVIDSPSSSVPPNRDEIHLSIRPITKDNWSRWQTKNSASVKSLILNGTFDLQDIANLLKQFKNLEYLEFSNGKYLCDSLEGSKLEKNEKLALVNVKHLILSEIDPPCENLYMYLTQHVEFPDLVQLTLKNVSIQFENEIYFHKLFKSYQGQLERLYLRNVTLLGNITLFRFINYPNLKEAELLFFPRESKYALESLKNFNLAAPKIEKFESNVYCVLEQWKQLSQRWEHLNNTQDICDK